MLRFRLKQLILFVTVLATAFAFIAHERRREQLELRIVTALSLDKGDVVLTRSWAHLGFQQVSQISIYGRHVSDRNIADLVDLHGLHWISFSHCSMTSGDVDQLGWIPWLNGIDLISTDLSGQEPFKKIWGHVRLREFRSSGSTLQNDQCVGLENNKRLEVLNLSDSAISDTTVNRLRHHPTLLALALRKTSISDACAPALASIDLLQELDVSENGLTDEFLVAFAPSTSLRELCIQKTQVSNSAIEKFKRRFPSCRVVN